MIRFFTFSQYHNKIPVAGSTHIRVEQLIKYWPEADLYKYGENPDALIFQKVYCGPDYKFPAHFENIKILDICDPDWLDGMAIKETVDAMDAVTVPTQALKDFIGQMTDKPIYIVPDRFDIELVPPEMKRHEGKARTAVWFGYVHNSDLLRPTLGLLNELGLKLLVISNDDPLLYRYDPERIKEEFYEFRRYDEETIYQDLAEADFALLPKGRRPEDRFKSNNKDIKAVLAGLPVADSEETMRLFMSARERNSYLHKNYIRIKADYDVRNSVRQYQDIIAGLKKGLKS
jgi:hypothetical protein